MTPKQRRLKRRRENSALDEAAGRKKEKLPSLKKLRKQLKDLVSEYVIERDSKIYGGVCLSCRAEPIYAALHIIPSSESLNTRYDPDNLYGGGRRCNFDELTRRSYWATVRFPQIFGHEKIMELHRRADINVKPDRADFMEKIAAMKSLLKA